MSGRDLLQDAVSAAELSRLLAQYQDIRARTVALCDPLSPEDCQAQSMADASPAKWHLAHTTWFFETFILSRFAVGYVPPFPSYRVLFNSYYNAVGEKHPRPQRGLLTRPALAEVLTYRRMVDDAMVSAISGVDRQSDAAGLRDLLVLGLHHEQQHQELILTDVKHLLSCNPLGPAYRRLATEDVEGAGGTVQTPTGSGPADGSAAGFLRFDGGVIRIGADGDDFSFDNEGPAHEVLLQPFELADRLVTCGEFLEFIQDGGYRRPEFWLSLGWDRVQAEQWQMPFYWRADGHEVAHFTLHGWQPIDDAAPAAHLSYFEADAFARWADARLPTEAEWEHAARRQPQGTGNLLEGGALRPLPAQAGTGTALRQLWGDLWEWTASAYGPYPGFRASSDAVGEYNGKFMCNQYVLRGGSFATSRHQARVSYRNFFPPEARWQFSGLRLARDAARCASDHGDRLR